MSFLSSRREKKPATEPGQTDGEGHQPFPHTAPDSPFNTLKFRARLLTDFQVRTVYHHLEKILPTLEGTILDVGCGEMPYRHLVTHPNATYVGIDIQDAAKFGYHNPVAIAFDGQSISSPDETFDHFMCTEVLEHVADPQPLVNEVYRVLKTGGTGIVTVPWSARCHYMPFDYHRFTPWALKHLFEKFSDVVIVPRGTDLTVIASKVIVSSLRDLFPNEKPAPMWLRALTTVPGVPLAIGAAALGHLSLALGWGSTADPLGYVVYVRK